MKDFLKTLFCFGYALDFYNEQHKTAFTIQHINTLTVFYVSNRSYTAKDLLSVFINDPKPVLKELVQLGLLSIPNTGTPAMSLYKLTSSGNALLFTLFFESSHNFIKKF